MIRLGRAVVLVMSFSLAFHPATQGHKEVMSFSQEGTTS